MFIRFILCVKTVFKKSNTSMAKVGKNYRLPDYDIIPGNVDIPEQASTDTY